MNFQQFVSVELVYYWGLDLVELVFGDEKGVEYFSVMDMGLIM